MPVPRLTINHYNSPVGTLTIVTSPAGLCRLAFANEAAAATEAYLTRVLPGTAVAAGDTPLSREVSAQLGEYFAGQRQIFDLPLDLHGTPFQRAVWTALQAIPYGTTCSYSDLAGSVGRPRAARATGQAIGKNPVGIIIPCHRVLGRGGRLVGFGGGLAVKGWLLEFEDKFENKNGANQTANGR